MPKRVFVFTILVLFSSQGKCGFFDSMFEPSPYSSEQEAIDDLKEILKHVSQCQWASCKYDGPKGVPSSDPYPSCAAYIEEKENFLKRYKLSGAVVKTELIDWYQNKIDEMDADICD